jgi:hypothetical protein
VPDGGVYIDEAKARIEALRVQPARWVKQSLFEAITGYTIKAQRCKMDDGVWEEGVVWKFAPDGNRVLNLDGYYAWIEGHVKGDGQ